MSFSEWNARLLDEFFGPACQDRNVLISVGADEINAIGPDLGGFAGLLDAVDAGPLWCPRYDANHIPNNLLNRHRTFGAEVQVYWRTHQTPAGYLEPATLVPWGQQQARFPAYLPIIAALVALYCEHPDDGGFYRNAHSVFGLPDDWGGAELTKIRKCFFGDLQEWSTVETAGTFGRFIPRRLGNQVQVHVGWLRGQSILRRTDEPRLKHIFHELGLTATDPLTAADQESLLTAIQNGQPPFSIGLRQASADRQYRDILLSRLDCLREDLDESGPPPEDDHVAEGQLTARAAEASTILFYRQGHPRWKLGLLLPPEAVATDEDIFEEIRIPDLQWAGRQTEDSDSHGFCVVSPSPETPGGLTSLESLRLLQNQRSSIRGCRRAAYLRHRDVRYFVPGDNRLVERDCLPDHDGHAYILASPNAVPTIHQTVAAHNAAHLINEMPDPQQPLPAAGWRLFHVPNSHALRVLDIPVPDGRAHQRPFRPITLTGGSVTRRAGRTWYLPYDLPTLHVDYPGPIELHALPAGIEFIPLPLAAAADPGGIPMGASRSYAIQVGASGAFNITARARDGHAVGNTLLRVDPWDIPPNGEDTVGLQYEGRSATTGMRVSGFDIMDGGELPPAGHIDAIQIDGDLGDVVLDRDTFVEEVRGNPLSRFLDWLAHRQAAFVPYSQAKRQLLNLAPDVTVPMSVLFRGLRRRGLLEIVTDRHGRWSGVARLPFVATRTCLASDGVSLAALSGTPSFHDWRTLMDQQGGIRRIDGFDDMDIPVVLLPYHPPLDFMSAVTPSDLANFSVSLNELQERWAHIGYEQDPKYTDEWLFVVDGTWKPRDNLLAPGMAPLHPEWTLWRSDDPWRQGSTIRNLRQRAAGAYRTRPIIDERWATWLSLKSFAERPDHAPHEPWPLHYSDGDAALWLPARLNLPLVLERALIACSGTPPREVPLTRFANHGQIYGADTGGVVHGPFYEHYERYLGAGNEARTWLEYRCVPREIAAIVAAKLSCRLVDY